MILAFTYNQLAQRHACVFDFSQGRLIMSPANPLLYGKPRIQKPLFLPDSRW
jgi:hypothetical protein